VKPEAIRPHILELTGDPKRDYDGLLREIGSACVVLLGEGTHGTREFYEERAKITKRLIEEKVGQLETFESSLFMKES
jgi:erythromycin esterase-like protein